MTFALCVAELRNLLPNVGILALDARNHGSTIVRDANGAESSDLSLHTISDDLVTAIRLTQTHMLWPGLPRILLIGHSLGGAVVVQVASSRALGNSLIGYGVFDVVEGSAMEALQFMKAYLATRPASFKSIDSAVEWHVRSRTLRNIKSARASVPSLLVRDSSYEGEKWLWRTDLSRTEEFWPRWFGGMSEKFLGSRGAKLLVLAGTDRLDKELMIGQMQGKTSMEQFGQETNSGIR
jgi:protein phosphatase methylesterase 1